MYLNLYVLFGERRRTKGNISSAEAAAAGLFNNPRDLNGNTFRNELWNRSSIFASADFAHIPVKSLPLLLLTQKVDQWFGWLATVLDDSYLQAFSKIL